MSLTLRSILAAGLALGVLTAVASAAPLQISSTVAEAGTVPQTGGPYQLTLTPYDYTAQAYNSLTSISSLLLTVTIGDGDTALGDYDRDNLTLALDGIDTGFKLNDFPNNVVETKTNLLIDLSGNQALANQILAALQADGQLIGTINDPTSASPPNDDISLSFLNDTTLAINGDTGNNGGNNNVPLPAAVLLAPLGAGLAGIYSRKFRK